MAIKNLITMTTEEIAQVCHEANRLLCKMNGDESQLSWEETPEQQQYDTMVRVQLFIENPYEPASYDRDDWEGLPDLEKMKGNLFVSIVRALVG
jgi:hypothetical protein